MNCTEKNNGRKLCDLTGDMSDLGYLCVTIHEMAKVLKEKYFEYIPLETEQINRFASNFYTMNELINVIWDYSYKVEKDFEAISHKFIEISNSMSENAKNTEGAELDG